MRIRYALHGVRFAVDAEEDLAEELAGVVMPGCIDDGPGRNRAVFCVRRRPGGRLAVVRGRRVLWHAASPKELVPWLEAEVVGWLLGQFRRRVPLHAALVGTAWRGGAVLLPGGPGCGKTSVACAAGLAGWSIMSDEVALAEPGAGTAAAFPRAMLVKPVTARRLPRLERVEPRRVVLDDGPAWVRYMNPAEVGFPAPATAAVEAIVFPRWARRTRLGPLGERAALERLLAASFDRRPKVTVETCVGLVRRAPSFTLSVGDLEQAAAQLAKAIEADRRDD